MKINISGHHVEVTEAIKQSFEAKFAKVAKHYPNLMSLSSIITVEPRQQKLEVSTFYEGEKVSVRASGKELYAAIAQAAKKLQAALEAVYLSRLIFVRDKSVLVAASSV